MLPQQVLLVAERMRFVVDDEPRPLTIFTEFERIRTSDYVSSLRLHLFVPLAGMRLFWSDGVLFIRINALILVVKLRRRGVEIVRILHTIQILGYRPVFPFVSDEITLL